MRPTALMSPVCAIPTMIVERRIGTMMLLMSAMNPFESS